MLVQRRYILQLELVGEDKICIFQETLVNRHDILVHVEPALISHHRVQDCGVVSLSPYKAKCLGRIKDQPQRNDPAFVDA